jgi:hypothetical protein
VLELEWPPALPLLDALLVASGAGAGCELALLLVAFDGAGAAAAVLWSGGGGV